MKMGVGVIFWEEKTLKEESWWFQSFRDVQVVIETMGLFEDVQGECMELWDGCYDHNQSLFLFKFILLADWITAYLLHFFLSR